MDAGCSRMDQGMEGGNTMQSRWGLGGEDAALSRVIMVMVRLGSGRLDLTDGRIPDRFWKPVRYLKRG